MKESDLYNDYLSKLENALINNDIESIDYILEYMYTNKLSDDYIEEIDEILNEATLYAEIWDLEYKEKALSLIDEFKQISINL